MANFFKDPLIDKLLEQLMVLSPKDNKTTLVIRGLRLLLDQEKTRKPPSARAVRFQRAFINLKNEGKQQ